MSRLSFSLPDGHRLFKRPVELGRTLGPLIYLPIVVGRPVGQRLLLVGHLIARRADLVTCDVH